MMCVLCYAAIVVRCDVIRMGMLCGLALVRVVRYGAVWYGIGAACDGMVRYGVLPCDVGRCCDAMRCYAMLCDFACCYGVRWWYGMVRYGMVWYGMVRYDTMIRECYVCSVMLTMQCCVC